MWQTPRMTNMSVGSPRPMRQRSSPLQPAVQAPIPIMFSTPSSICRIWVFATPRWKTSLPGLADWLFNRLRRFCALKLSDALDCSGWQWQVRVVSRRLQKQFVACSLRDLYQVLEKHIRIKARLDGRQDLYLEMAGVTH